MENTPNILPEIILLRELLSVQEKQLSDYKELVAQKDEQLARKNERILYLERQIYGRRSEKKLPSYDQAQLSLFDTNQGEESLEEEKTVFKTLADEIKDKAAQRRIAKKAKAAKEPRSYQIPSTIERREEVLQPLTYDANTMVKIGEDITERLMLEPSKFYVERLVRPIYKLITPANTVSSIIVQGPAKSVILPGTIAGESLIAQIAIDKFLYHLPEYRQNKRFKELGFAIGTSRINRWVHGTADRLYGLYVAQMERVLKTNYIQVDETSHSIIDRPGSARKGYIWAVRSVLTPGIFFYYDDGSRSQKVLLEMLKGYQGALQSDGYAAYSIYENKKGVLPLGCMAHVRRKFENALSSTPEAQKALDYIALLYMLEENLRTQEADYEQIRKEREEKAYPILQQMEQWMKQTVNNCTPKSPLGKAISYAFGMWPRVSRYCKEGYYQIDNNGIEIAIRPLVLGRKNYLFSGNNDGAFDNCIYYTLIGSCLQAGVDPHQWFSSVLEKIPSLQTPINWDALLP